MSELSMISFAALNPNKSSVKDRLDQLAQQNTGLWQLAKQTEALMPKMTDQDWISYKDRWRNFGEEAAGRWLINKYGQK